VLRPVYLFLALGLSVAVALAGAWQLVYYTLARILGVERPGDSGGNLLLAAAGPLSLVAVYGVSWLYHQRALAAQARAQPELPRQAGVRRLYVYLVSLISLAVLATGAGGLLWTLADLATNAPRTVTQPTWWQERISLFVSMMVVGLPVWLRHWGPVAAATDDRAAEAGSLARRLYVYLALLGGVLALLGAGVAAAQQLLSLALGEAAAPSVVTNLARSLAVALVAGQVVAYHARVLRADAGERQDARVKEQEEQAESRAPGVTPSQVNQPQFGLVVRRGREEAVEWFSAETQARAAYERARAESAADWVGLVRVEAQDVPRAP
jgi:hypothetical protein